MPSSTRRTEEMPMVYGTNTGWHSDLDGVRRENPANGITYRLVGMKQPLVKGVIVYRFRRLSPYYCFFFSELCQFKKKRLIKLMNL
ncbi:hypothetical protein Hanom_Chr04g00364231 [Helianthus anomalus]